MTPQQRGQNRRYGEGLTHGSRNAGVQTPESIKENKKTILKNGLGNLGEYSDNFLKPHDDWEVMA